MNTEDEFVFEIRQALNEAADQLDHATQLRLARARHAALAHMKAARASERGLRMPSLRLAHAGTGAVHWLRSLGIAAPLCALSIGLAGIHQWRQAQQTQYVAQLEFALLLDHVPIQAYADQAFGAHLAHSKNRNR